jgi:hypothetical protein
MKARLSFTIAVAITALAVAVPTAFAEGRITGSLESAGVTYFDANEQATSSGMDAIEYFRANELATAARSGGTDATTYRDGAERAVPLVVSAPVASTVDSGRDIEWGQIAVAFGIGLLLALGLATALRLRPSRPLAQ